MKIRWLLLLLALAGPLPAQEIESHHVVTLAGPDGEGFPWEMYSVTRLEDGRWVAGARSDLHVFSPGGAYMRDVGREGQGPGEWLRIDYVARRGDSLAVFDSGNGRMTLLAPDMSVARTFPLPALVSGLQSYGDGFVFTGSMASGDSGADWLGRSLFFLDATGNIMAAAQEHDVTPLKGAMAGKSLLAIDGRSVWTLRLHEPRLEQYFANGRSQRLLELERPDWWATSMLDDSFQKYTPDQVPPSINMGVRVEGDRLWTITNTPVKRWRAAFGPPVTGEGGIEYHEFDPTSIFRTAVELRSLTDGSLIARRFLTGMSYPSELSADGYRVKIRTNDLGLTFIDVERITLTR